MFFTRGKRDKSKWPKTIYKRTSMYILSVVFLFVFIGLLTTIRPAYRFSSETVTVWTSTVHSSTFLHLIGFENRTFKKAFPKEIPTPNLSTIFLQIATNLKIDDPKSLLGREIPGFSPYGEKIIIAGEGTSYETLSIESAPPLDEILKDRKAVLEEKVESTEEKSEDTEDALFRENVVFLYNTHNRESFLPHLPDVTDPNLAHHNEVNVTKISDQLAVSLSNYGIGAFVDETDIMQVLKEKDWSYTRSYDASRPIVQEALASKKEIQYVFDIHRDSLPKKQSTKEIDGKNYAKLLFIVGAEYASFEKNLALATELHYLIEEKYPGLSRGVLTKEGAGSNGVYNQDLTENSLLLEFGGYDNTLEELYRTVDVVAEVFSEYYWDAEKVDGKN